MEAPTPARPAGRRGGRPTLEEAARLDRDVREQALRLFLEYGYERTSMDAIARAAGTTKASLYARFPSKEAVFLNVFGWAVTRPDWPVPEPEPPDPGDLEAALTAFADAALRRALHPAMLAMNNIAVAQAHRFPDLRHRTGELYWPRLRLVADLLRTHAATGEIRADEPEILAEHFLAMVASTPGALAAFGIVRDPVEQRHRTRVAVQLFLRGLRP